jgi:hypothetical protein
MDLASLFSRKKTINYACVKKIKLKGVYIYNYKELK